VNWKDKGERESREVKKKRGNLRGEKGKGVTKIDKTGQLWGAAKKENRKQRNRKVVQIKVPGRVGKPIRKRKVKEG